METMKRFIEKMPAGEYGDGLDRIVVGQESIECELDFFYAGLFKRVGCRILGSDSITLERMVVYRKARQRIKKIKSREKWERRVRKFYLKFLTIIS